MHSIFRSHHVARHRPSLTSLPGALQLCQMYMYQAAVVQLPPFPMVEALLPHKMDRVSHGTTVHGL
jgi:hypothetical protein